MCAGSHPDDLVRVPVLSQWALGVVAHTTMLHSMSIITTRVTSRHTPGRWFGHGFASACGALPRLTYSLPLPRSAARRCKRKIPVCVADSG